MAGLTKKLSDVVERARAWPEETQDQLAEFALALEEEGPGPYRATEDELKAIDEAERSGLASDEEVVAALAKFRRA